MGNQYIEDKSTFIKLFSLFTSISVTKLNSFLKKQNLSILFEHPNAIGVTPEQLNKIQQLQKLNSLYNNLKDNDQKYCIGTSNSAIEYFQNYLSDIKDKEYLVCAYLDSGNNIISTDAINGTVNEVTIYPREIIKNAIMFDARSIIISHNHPSGRANPSPVDINLTKTIANAAETVGIELLDHIIVAEEYCYSFKQHGIMPSVSSFVSNSASQSQEHEYEDYAEI